MKKPIICGIYKITSPSGKIYIGQSVDAYDRTYAYAGGHCEDQQRLYNSINKYGWKNHSFEVIHECEDIMLDHWETYYIYFFDTFKTAHGLNLREGGDRTILTEEARNKIGEKRRNKTPIDKFSMQTGKFLGQGECAMKIQDEYGYKGKCILKACFGKLKTYKGFIWRFGIKGVIPSDLSQEEIKRASTLVYKTEDGGESYEVPQNIRDAASEWMKGNKNGQGRIVSKEEKEKSRQRMLGKQHGLGSRRTEEQKAEASKNHPNKIAVAQYRTDTGELVGVFDSYIAVEKKLGFHYTAIRGCCNKQGQKAIAYGYLWRKFKGQPILRLSDEEIRLLTTKKLQPNIRPVDEFDMLTGIFKRQWDSMWQVQTELGYNNSNIAAVCRGRMLTYKNSIWRYAVKGVVPSNLSVDEVKKALSSGKEKKVIQKTLSGEPIKIWFSMAEIYRELGYSQSCICLVCAGKNKQAYGYKWEYYTEQNKIAA